MKSQEKFKTIVVGLDFSPYSRIVLKQAQLLARLSGAELVAVHVSGTLSRPYGMELAQLDDPFEIEEMKRQFNRHYRLDQQGITSVVVVGAAAQALARIAGRYKNPLIVVGYKGRSMISRFLLGSTAEQLIRISTYPVWIQRGTKVVKPNRILVPHDLSKLSDKALTAAKGFTKGKAPNIEAVFVTELPIPTTYYEGWMIDYNDIMDMDREAVAKFRAEHPNLKVRHPQGNAIQKILAMSSGFDLVVLRPHKKKEIGYARGRITNKVLRASPKPVLVLN